MRETTLRLSRIALLMMAACQPPVMTMDVPDAGSLNLAAPAPVVAPEPVQLTPCPPGWNEVPDTEGAPAGCEPWPATATPACAADEARFPGEPACHRLGTDCTADGWATGLPGQGQVLYVQSGAAAGGAGTRGSPFDSIAAAMAAASSGAVIALSKGTFTEAVRLKAGVTLWGACLGQTVLAAPGSAASAVYVEGSATALKNLRINGPKAGVLLDAAGRALELTDVAIDGAVGVGLATARGARVTGQRVVIRRTTFDSSGYGGQGLDVELGASATLSSVALEDNHTDGLYIAENGTRVSLTDAVIRGTQASADGSIAFGLELLDQSSLTLTRAVIEQNVALGVLVHGPAATLTATDVVIRGTRSSANSRKAGVGLLVEGQSTITLLRCALLDNRTVGLNIREAAVVHASHLVVNGTRPTESTGADGVGIDMIERSELSLDHAWLSSNRAFGLGVSQSSAALTDVEIRSTTPSAGLDGTGLQVTAGGGVNFSRLVVATNERLGVLVDGADTVLVGQDLAVRDNRVSAQNRTNGDGVAVQHGAQAALAHVAITGNRTVGLTVRDASSSATIEDLTLSDTASDDLGEWGRAIHLEAGGQLTLTRALIERHRDVGLMVANGAHATCSELVVGDITPRDCSVAGTCELLGGSGVVVVGEGSSVAFSRFSLRRAAMCGVQLAQGGVGDFHDGEVTDNLIGACVQTAGFDVERLATGVEYRNNGTKLDALEIPLPPVTRPGF